MKKILGKMRRAIDDYNLIEKGDRIAVGVSGGKDSLVLLKGLSMLKKFIGIDFDVFAITLDPHFNNQPMELSRVGEFCENLGVTYKIVHSEVYKIVFEIRKEKNPCALCANLRRGALHVAAKDLGCNKMALGHNYNDVIETFIMNLFNEGRLGCFAPKTYLDRRDITLIRPLVLCEENEIISVAQRYNLPVLKSPCPVDGHTNRETTKNFIKQFDREQQGFSQKIFTAMKNADLNGWKPRETPKR
ncbi:MAG: tRNA 2-thiocytidine(32) synthetase TtcA [Oscillospiraceae bacterium]|jgi:tRNA(Ile)-lysidine synthase TilS/MesJ|nr:tRNA 2-thiocytidine(32) synthetase TtcA [Oscillospiraceae bacterium]